MTTSEADVMATRTAESELPPGKIGFDNLDRDAVGRVAGSVELHQIRMLWGHAALNCEPHELPDGWAEAVMVGWDAHYMGIDEHSGLLVTHTVHFAHYNIGWGDINEVERELSRDPENPDDLEVAASFILEYDLVGDRTVSPDDMPHFAFFNSTFNAWPYFREYANGMTQRMGIPGLVVPVLRVPKL